MKEQNGFELLVECLQQLPSVGRKSAMRLAYTLSVENKPLALQLAHYIETAVRSVRLCDECGGVSENELCEICTNPLRENGELCIVQHPKDILTLEETHFFEGRYFVVESIDGFRLEALRSIVQMYHIQEIIFAFTPSVATDALLLYIEDKLLDLSLFFTKIAQGVPSGVSLENVDQTSLLRAFKGRKQL